MLRRAALCRAQALGIDANRHDALWCLGNAYTSQGFLSAEAASGGCWAAAGPVGPAGCSHAGAGSCSAAPAPPVPAAPLATPDPSPHPCPPPPAAAEYFDKAGGCFKKAVELEPSNDSYRRALEMSGKAPQLYAELQRQLAAAGAGGSPRAAPEGRAAGGAAKQVRGGGGRRGAAGHAS